MRKGFKGIDVLAEYYHRNANEKVKKTNTEYASDLCDFIELAITKMGRYPAGLILDNGAAFYLDVKNISSLVSVECDGVDYTSQAKTNISKCDVPCRLTGANHFMEAFENPSGDKMFI